jgi:hypothetical protein
VNEVVDAGAGGAGERDLRREFLQARRKCTPKQRTWLKSLPKNDFQYWKAALAAGFSRDTVWRWLRQPHVKRVLDLMREIDELDADVGRHRVIRNWEQQAHADLRLFFRQQKDDKGLPVKTGEFELIPPHEWTDEMAGMVQELSFDVSGKPKLKLYNRQDATLTLAKYNKMIIERHEVDLKDAPPPKITIVRRARADG